MLSYIRVDIVREDNTRMVKWVRIEEGLITISLPQDTKHLFLVLDQATPYALYSITDSSGIDLTQDVRYHGIGYITPKYAFINLTKAKLSEVIVKIVKSRSFPLIYEIEKHNSANLGEVAIPPKSSRKLSFDIMNCIGAMLNLVMLSDSQILLNCSSVNLIDFELKTLEIPGIGSKEVKLVKYIVFDTHVEIMNLGKIDAIALVNITPILITQVDYYVYGENMLIVNSSTRVIMLSLPYFAELHSIKNGITSRRDPLFSKPLPNGFYAIEVKRMPLEINVEFRGETLFVRDVEGKPVRRATLRLTYPNDKVKYVECGGQVTVNHGLVPYVLIDVFMEGFKISSFNLTSFPDKVDLCSAVSPLIVYVVDDKGRPLPNASVQLFSYLSYDLLSTVTDEDGKAMFDDIPLHYNYTLIVKFKDKEVSRLTFQLETREIKVIPCNIGRVTFVICNQRNQRVSNINLQIFYEESKVINLTINESGESREILLPFSKYRVKAFSHSLCVYEGELFVSRSGKYVLVIESYKLVIKVKDALGTPLKGAVIALVLTEREHEEIDIKTTDHNGVVVFYNLPKNSYVIEVKLGWVKKSTNVELNGDTYLEFNLPVIRVTDTLYLPSDGVIITVSVVIISLVIIVVVKIKKRNIVIIE